MNTYKIIAFIFSMTILSGLATFILSTFTSDATEILEECNAQNRTGSIIVEADIWYLPNSTMERFFDTEYCCEGTEESYKEFERGRDVVGSSVVPIKSLFFLSGILSIIIIGYLVKLNMDNKRVNRK